MKILMISRATLFLQPGGDTIQLTKTAEHINLGTHEHGFHVDIKTADQNIDFSKYDLLHFFNISRPSDYLGAIYKSKLPYVISTIFVDYSEVEKNHFKASRRILSKIFSTDKIEYFKTISRFLKKQEKITSYRYFLLGQKNSIKTILKKAKVLMPNSKSEYNRLFESYGINQDYIVVPNGIDTEVFKKKPIIDNKYKKFKNSIISVGQLTPVKNHINLIMALNNTEHQLFIIGSPSLNAKNYFNKCLNIASKNINFIEKLSQEDLSIIYSLAKVHVLPSWFETTGLVSLEAAYSGCNIVITNRGDQVEYFEDNAFYCEPDNVESIKNAIERALKTKPNDELKNKILTQYNWHNAALKTIKAYKKAFDK